MRHTSLLLSLGELGSVCSAMGVTIYVSNTSPLHKALCFLSDYGFLSTARGQAGTFVLGLTPPGETFLDDLDRRPPAAPGLVHENEVHTGTH